MANTYKEFPLKAKNCKASLVVSDQELRASGMINAQIDVDTSNTDFTHQMEVALKPKLETMLFDTCLSDDSFADDFFSIISGNQLLIKVLRKPKQAVSKLIVHCKVNN